MLIAVAEMFSCCIFSVVALFRVVRSSLSMTNRTGEIIAELEIQKLRLQAYIFRLLLRCLLL